MSDVWLYTLASVIFVSLISFIGASFLFMSHSKLRNVVLYLVSLSAGALLGDAFIHLLPEAVGEASFEPALSLYVLIGIVVSLAIEKTIHWQHPHGHIHHHHHPSEEHIEPFAIMNLFGEAVHNFIDGLIIGASYLVSVPVGIATTIAVVLHEIPAELGDFGVLVHGGFSPKKALFFNFLVALTAILGAGAALLLSVYALSALTFLLPFAAGTFIYIAASNLIPEMQKETKPKTSVLQFLVFVSGIVLMYLITLLE